MAVCAETQYWHSFCCARARGDALTRQQVEALPPFAMPCRPRNALRASGELAKTLEVRDDAELRLDCIKQRLLFGVGDFVGDDFDTGHDVTPWVVVGVSLCCRQGPLCQR